MGNPIQYTSRTFDTILSDFNNDPELVDKPEWTKRGWAGLGDMLSLYMNALANNNFLDTAYTKSAVVGLCANIDYYLAGRASASGTLLFDLSPNTIFPITIDQSDLVALSPGTTTTASQRFEGQTSLVATAQDYSFLPGAVNTSLSQITVTTNYPTGAFIVFSSSGTLPAPLSFNTSYYIININPTTIQVAGSRANAFAGIPITLTTQGTGSHTLYDYSYLIAANQQQTISQYVVGTSDGITQWQQYQLNDIGILAASLIVTINNTNWLQVESFATYTSISQVYSISFNTDGSAQILFGNGQYGAIPGNFPIYVSYAICNGSIGNITALNKITNYAGSNSTAVINVTNISSFTGGANEENTATAKRLAPLQLKSRGRFIEVEDGEALVLNYGGVALCRVIPNQFGPLSCLVVGVADGGGQVSAPLQAKLQTLLIDASIMQSIDVRFQNAKITPFNVTSSVSIKPGFVFSTQVLPYFTLGWQLFFSETASEILDEYSSFGIVGAINLINTIFGSNFGVIDYTPITNLLSVLTQIGPNDFGTLYEISTAFTLIEGGLSDRINYISPYGAGTTTFPSLPYPTPPTQPLAYEISTVGTLTLTQV